MKHAIVTRQPTTDSKASPSQSQSEKDRRSLTGVAITLGPTLLAEAAAVLGEHEEEAADVLQDFYVYLLEGRLRHAPADGAVMPWMCGLVRTIAQRRRAERERDQGNWDWDADSGG